MAALRRRAGPALIGDRPRDDRVRDVRPLTASETQRLLDEHDLALRRADGQNLLVDPNTVERILDAAGLADDDAVLEIGPGLGALTGPLAGRVRRVVAVEVDAGFVTVLRERLGHLPPVEIHHADAVELDLTEVTEEPLRMVASLPYSVATALLLEHVASPLLTDAFVMVQREVGERWAAGPGDDAYGAPSVKLALTADVDVELSIPRTVFLPAPHVDSVMVRVTPRADAPGPGDAARVGAVVDAAFTHRRKTLRNSLGAAFGRDAADRGCRQAGVDSSRRPERLSAEDFRRLAAALEVPTGGP